MTRVVPVTARQGMTLVEMLVATAATLVLMAAVAQVFSVFGSAVTNSRSMIELDARMRTIAWKLRSDLSGATARTLPPLEPSANSGYFEIIEGSINDSNAAAGSTTLAADTDDVLLFTTQSSDPPFLGKAGGAMIESPTAEVAWFLRPTTGTSPTTYTLFRRQLLVMGYAGFAPFLPTGQPAKLNNTTAFAVYASRWSTFYDSYDLSVRREGLLLIPNTLADLTRRESRFMHNPNGITDGTAFPYAFTAGVDGLCFDSSSGSQRVGEDVVLTNVIAFDVRVFDPAAPIAVSTNDALAPGDPGFDSGGAATGCYVDLGNGKGGHFGSTAQGNYRGQAIDMQGTVWDTWSTHYESNGIDEDSAYGADQGTDGLDNINETVSGTVRVLVDEAYEQETSPPYPYPLRGIEIRIRCYEPSSRQVRQVTVRHTFVPH